MIKFGVQYDETLRIATVRSGIWSSIMPVRWFPNYKIVSPVEVPVSLRGLVIRPQDYLLPHEEATRKTIKIYSSDAFARLYRDKLAGYRFVMPATLMSKINFPKLLDASDVALHYENKVELRRMFSEKIPFPRFRIVSLSKLLKREILYDDLVNDIGCTDLVLQRPKESGGRGTYFIAKNSDLSVSIEDAENWGDKEVVVSEQIKDAAERSLQFCVISDGRVLVGPPQIQLVGHEKLVGLNNEGVKSCGGGVWPGLMDDKQYKEAKRIGRLIGKRIHQAGYRGIFGIDYLVNREGTLYILEVNARTTGLSPLVASLQDQVPFQLLHILELADSKYSLKAVPSLKGEGSFLEVMSQGDGYYSLVTGLYTLEGERIGNGFEDSSLVPKDSSQLFFAMRVSPSELVPNGKAVGYIYSAGRLFTNDGELTMLGERAVKIMKHSFNKA